MITRVLLMVVSALTIISCGTSKSVKDLMDSYQYGIKKVHIENRNSSYDNLTADYLESQKSQNQRDAEKMAKDTLISMRKGPCLGRCPVYTITIYNNGMVKYDAVANTEMEGIFESKIEDGQRKEIERLMSQIPFPRLATRYPAVLESVADVARTTLVMSDDGLKYSTVISYGEPEILKEVQTYMEKLTKELSWVQI